jgi:hypothetical protein
MRFGGAEMGIAESEGGADFCFVDGLWHAKGMKNSDPKARMRCISMVFNPLRVDECSKNR